MTITISPRAIEKRAADVLGYVRICIREGYGFPTPQLIGGRFGWDVRNAQAALDALVASGEIVRTDGRLALASPAANGDAGGRGERMHEQRRPHQGPNPAALLVLWHDAGCRVRLRGALCAGWPAGATSRHSVSGEVQSRHCGRAWGFSRDREECSRCNRWQRVATWYGNTTRAAVRPRREAVPSKKSGAHRVRQGARAEEEMAPFDDERADDPFTPIGTNPMPRGRQPEKPEPEPEPEDKPDKPKPKFWRWPLGQ